MSVPVWEPGGAKTSQKDPGGPRRSEEEPGGARSSQEQPGGAWRSLEEPGGKELGVARGCFKAPWFFWLPLWPFPELAPWNSLEQGCT